MTNRYKNVLFLLLITVSTNLAYSQPDTSDYRRADNLISITSGKVFYGNVRPTWINSTGRFLYESTTPSGIEYYIVDANSLTKRTAFDQARFAASFELATGQAVEPGKLPIRNLVFSERMRSFSFIYDDTSWICGLRNYRLIKGDRDRRRERTGGDGWIWGFRYELANDPVVSPDKKFTAFIRDYNVYIRSNEDNSEYQLSFEEPGSTIPHIFPGPPIQESLFQTVSDLLRSI